MKPEYAFANEQNIEIIENELDRKLKIYDLDKLVSINLIKGLPLRLFFKKYSQ
ncbi:MAG: hypothetical protein U9M94_04245 [Patescibacteria group bacterium]|nr:hypothetical protein [Patescibacteria group bacterium]